MQATPNSLSVETWTKKFWKTRALTNFGAFRGLGATLTWFKTFVVWFVGKTTSFYIRRLDIWIGRLGEAKCLERPKCRPVALSASLWRLHRANELLAKVVTCRWYATSIAPPPSFLRPHHHHPPSHSNDCLSSTKLPCIPLCCYLPCLRSACLPSLNN